MADETVLYLPIGELAARIRGGEVSPIELTRLSLARLERLGPRLNAVVTILRERALERAREAAAEIRAGDYRGPLHGIPYGAKDLFAAEGAPTTWGAAPFRDQVFDYDAAVIRRLREAGAILVAKLASVELAGGLGYDRADASFTGPGRTPWNLDYWSGGSSSGPGAAVAAALVPYAIGTETWGSIITPAAFSGVTGLRPTYGRVSRHGAMALSWTMDKIGPLCRTADGCGIVLDAVAGLDERDPYTLARPYDYPDPEEAAPPFRIGILKGARDAGMPEVAENFRRSLDVLGGFATLVEAVELPDLPYAPSAITIIEAEAASAFEELLESGRAQGLTAPGSRYGAYNGLAILAKDYIRALRLRGVMQQALDELFEGYDAIVHPTRSTVAYPIGIPFDEAYPDVEGREGPSISGAANIAGLPGIALPNGFGRAGLPTSLAFTGRAFEENRLIRLARAFQEETDWHTRRPPVG